MVAATGHTHTAQQGKASKSDSAQILYDQYKQFIFQGYVGLLHSSIMKLVIILHDNRASQSLLLESTLFLSEKTFTGVNVLIQGVELEPISVPLHEVKLQSNIVSGLIKVEVRVSLLTTKVTLILIRE